MPMTIDQVVEETRQWPAERVMELMERLDREVRAVPDVDAAWKAETRRRMDEIRSGKTEGISGEVVAAHVRRIVGR